MDERGATNLCDLLTLAGEAAPPPAASEASALYFIVVRGGVPGQMIPVGAGSQTLGRTPEAEIQIADMSVSRRHASLLVDCEGRAWLTDIGSTNGTYLNGQRLAAGQTAGLRDGDRVGLGPGFVLKFVHTDALDEHHHREMFERSVRDPLTGLYNRAYFLNQLTLLAHQTCRRDLGLAVVMLDIDHFKRINDAYGHEAGDDVLRHVSGVLRQSTRADDLVARYGGEEFIAALPIISLEHARDRCERVRAALAARTIAVAGRTLSVTASVGVAFASPDSPKPADALIRGADQALYRAKGSGRNRVVLDLPDPDDDASGDELARLILLEGSLPNALATGLTTVDFEVYQD